MGTQLVTQEQSTVAKLYGGQENVNDLAAVVKKVAPWAKEMTNDDIGLSVRRAVAMGLDPLNSHEVQIWKDKRGNVSFQLAYTLMAEWVSYFKGDFTDPQYRRLTENELLEEGLAVTTVAYRCSFMLKKDIPLLGQLIEAGYPPDHARRMIEITGLGSAYIEEYNDKYFAPAGRSKSWKVQKRAFTDAVRRKWGTPSRPEIEELRRYRGSGNLTLGDWSESDGSEEGAQLAETTRLALEEFSAMSEQQKAERIERNRNVLHGDVMEWDDVAFECGSDADDQQEPRRNDPSVPWVTAPPPDKFESPSLAVKWGFDQGVFKSKKHAENAYNECKRENSPRTAEAMRDLWVDNVAQRLADKLAAEDEKED